MCLRFQIFLAVLRSARRAEKVLKLIREGIELHIEALREAGEPVPPPTSKSELIKVHAA